MTNIYQTEFDDDDALGSAMRAFVDELLAKGADANTIIYLMALSVFRTALFIMPEHARVLSIAVKAGSDLEMLRVASGHIPAAE